ncbi:RagB/SusD family nutrient uptake outer membrane protein [Sphingobacterium hotanense]|uniref:RagB/SusD family nutrient uptake outer membrane protein n=1 Tax=Sphingobacterium hotanense TaxID=649196 RepID=A0ABT7NMT7_9SPHI|nr:RagB/SusD family nutrient uptake outer membrane protein [Sphingobacterium hotanense]MDM1048566.1 RagB/SusD family nutrient uptake outer membrane protein [Sphingobacterium hotanense]
MKIIKNLSYSVLAFSLLASSCGKKLDMEPQDDISSENALSTAADVNNVLVGAYTIMAEPALYGTNLVMIGDLYASPSYLNWTGSFSTYRDISNQNLISTNEDATRTWTHAYQAINAANTVIESLDVVTDPDMKNELHGKALFIRGSMHFELVRLYALPYEAGAANGSLGVPIVTKAVKGFEDIISDIARSTVAQVYDQAQADLIEAVSLLSDSPDLYAAKGMLARLYLQKGDYPNAREQANDIIESGEYSLASNLEDPFRVKNSSEGVFEIQQNEQSNAGSSNDGLATFYSSYLNNTGGKVGRGDLSILNAFVNTYATTDKRRTQMIYEGTGAKTGWFTKKWYNYFDNIPVVRLTELYLTRAECNARLGTSVGDSPANDINALRQRAGLADLATVTVNDILAERDKELAFEGYRIHDLKRTKRNVGTYTYNAPELVFPIPYREVSVNSNLEQNPGYN